MEQARPCNRCGQKTIMNIALEETRAAIRNGRAYCDLCNIFDRLKTARTEPTG